MKKKKHVLFIAASLFVAGAATSCSEDGYASLASDGNAVRVAAATVGRQTRASATDEDFAEGDAFRLSTSVDGTNAATYTKGTERWHCNDPLIWGSTFPVTYYAAYPVAATYGSFTLPTDQSNGTSEANYMTASVEAQEKRELSLAFQHKTAQVIVKIAHRAEGHEGELSDAVIRSPHSGYANAAVAGSVQDIAPQASFSETDEEVCYTVLVVPGKVQNFNLFSVKVSGKDVSFNTDIAFEENHVYEYTLTIGADRLSLVNFTVKEWTEKDLAASMTPQWDGTAADSYAGGSGTKDDPWKIANAAQLAYMGKQLAEGYPPSEQYLQLTADIDLAGANWIPMGANGKPFRGHFDGMRHTLQTTTKQLVTNCISV